MLAINKVLYPTDFSEDARSAMNLALFFAEQYDAELHMLHVNTIHQDASDEEVDGHLTWPPELSQRAQELADSEMNKWLAPLREKPLRIIEAKRKELFAGPAILSYAEEQDIDLIVMGTHGRRGFRRAMLGSVAEEVLQKAECPVLTLRYDGSEKPVEAMSQLMVPIDFSSHSRQALQSAIAVARIYKSHIHLVHIINDLQLPAFYSPMIGPFEGQQYEQVRKDALETLDSWMHELEGTDVPFTTHVRVGSTAERIISFAKEQDISLLVIATHGLTGLKHMLFGSTAEQVVRYVGCPVMVLKSFGKSLLPPSDD